MIKQITTRTKQIVLGLLLLVTIALLGILSLTFLNEDWLKNKIEKHIHQQYQADITIDSMQFEVIKGHALLSGIMLNHSEQNKKIAASIKSIEMDCQLFPLIFRKIRMNQLIISEPNLVFDIQRTPKDIPETTLSRIQNLIYETDQSQTHPSLEAVCEIIEALTGQVDDQIIINKLNIYKGTIQYQSAIAGNEPFQLKIKALDYSVNHINAKCPIDFLLNADISSNIILDETEAKLLQNFSQPPYSLSLTGINMEYLGRFSKYDDILQITNGIGNADFLMHKNTILSKIRIDNIELSQTPDANNISIAFIPSDKIVSYINKQNGNLLFEFDIDTAEIQTSHDLEYFTMEIWENLWKEFIYEAAGNKLKKLKDAGTQKFREFFNNDKEDASE